MKLFDWLRAKKAPAAASGAMPTPDETRLLGRIANPGDGALFGADEWAAVERLLARGAEHDVIELLRRWIAAQPKDLDATLRLCELLCGRLEHAAARPLLERLTSGPQRLRALVLLAEGAERAGDVDAARRSYERVLAYDLDHPRVRSAADRLGSLRGGVHAGAAPPTLDGPAQVGTPIGGRYRLIDELGRGASGTVYLAEDVALEREVALKILHPRDARDRAEARLRAWEEARVSAALRHPGVATTFDLDEERQTIAMELCRGGSLRDRLRRGPLSPREAVSALGQLVAILAAAHERGIVHGDVKPANLLLRRALDDSAPPLAEDELVLCDFGIARLSDGATPAVEQRAVHGTLVYMAPEQRQGLSSPAADLYAAGIVALELFAGEAGLAPLLADRAALLRGEVHPDGRLPADVAARLGERTTPVEALLGALLQQDPAKRPTALAVSADLRALVV